MKKPGARLPGEESEEAEWKLGRAQFLARAMSFLNFQESCWKSEDCIKDRMTSTLIDEILR